MKLRAIVVLTLFAMTSAEVSAQGSQRPSTSKTIQLNVELIEIGSIPMEELERAINDRTKLDQLIAANKAQSVASLRLRTKAGEQGSARVGERVPVQVATLPSFQLVDTGPRGTGRPVTTSTPGVPQLQYENVGLSIDALPTIGADGQLEIKLRFEMTAVDRSTGTLTPTFLQRSFNDVVRVKPGEPLVLFGLQQNASGSATTPSFGRAATRGSFVLVLNTKTFD